MVSVVRSIKKVGQSPPSQLVDKISNIALLYAESTRFVMSLRICGSCGGVNPAYRLAPETRASHNDTY